MGVTETDAPVEGGSGEGRAGVNKGPGQVRQEAVGPSLMELLRPALRQSGQEWDHALARDFVKRYLKKQKAASASPESSGGPSLPTQDFQIVIQTQPLLVPTLSSKLSAFVVVNAGAKRRQARAEEMRLRQGEKRREYILGALSRAVHG